MGIDLSVIWFVIIVFATLMYIVMDGFDLGLAFCSPRRRTLTTAM
jgi:cytochrome d ubiquinol oxidase subunit II